jgi:23S rRNA pseudouridine1911/1915/1917 synthase
VTEASEFRVPSSELAFPDASAPLGFDILYESGPCLVVLKPAGVATQAPPGIDSLEVRIRAFLKQRAAAAGDVYLGLPHRLDRPVSGAMVFALNIRAARRISKQFERREIDKVYWALTAGTVDPPEGTWRDILWKVHGQPRAAVVDETHPHGQPAVLHYRTLGQHRLGSWLEIRLETGRTHQVRVQAASRGYALLGDAHYGSPIAFGPQTADERLRAIGLHARRLGFQHPLTRLPVSIEAPVPPAWLEWIDG